MLEHQPASKLTSVLARSFFLYKVSLVQRSENNSPLTKRLLRTNLFRAVDLADAVV